jgi:hypothetical protein
VGGYAVSDLLELLDELDVDPTAVHALMPWMGLACGADVLAVMRAGQSAGRRSVTLHLRERPGEVAVTCGACLAVGDLPALARASQRPERMAKVEQ